MEHDVLLASLARPAGAGDRTRAQARVRYAVEDVLRGERVDTVT